ncbi:hypothetical protein [Pararhodobacter aggregans]|uniref:hypothetical protein n=1 Tax=Pararhodobacter aggregans TaxID=404875 RepID=UPI003A92DED1
MSDAMTNREIEDVLTSIRRLVAQEGGRGAEAGRLILTEAQRVNAAPEAEADADEAQVAIPAPDFGKLEATIAELEAAFATSEFEGDNAADSEAPRASNVTELYGRLSFAHRGKEAEVATQAEPAMAAAPVAEPPAPVEPVPEAPAVTEALAAEPAADLADYLHSAANDGDPALSGEEDTVLDEETLRLLVAQIVREELKGQLGERITQQVRKLVRAEIAKALDERSYL